MFFIRYIEHCQSSFLIFLEIRKTHLRLNGLEVYVMLTLMNFELVLPPSIRNLLSIIGIQDRTVVHCLDSYKIFLINLETNSRDLGKKTKNSYR
ncbi:hypothetical protein CCP3SC1_40007 [Gammaproteobacteria bacterium]